MIVERRSLIKGLVALVAAPAIVKVGSLMPVNAALQPSNLLTMEQVTREAVRLFASNNRLLQALDRQYTREQAFWDGEQWGADHAKIGDTIRIRVPNHYIVLEADGTGELARGTRYWVPTTSPLVPLPDKLALAAAACVAAPVLLEKPVTRRFWAA